MLLICVYGIDQHHSVEMEVIVQLFIHIYNINLIHLVMLNIVHHHLGANLNIVHHHLGANVGQARKTFVATLMSIFKILPIILVVVIKNDI
uniref:Uncharacterized protein n=1 Tax=Acrobeloides nanus TaxID=290746 RepID=A0A914C251_9BILA